MPFLSSVSSSHHGGGFYPARLSEVRLPAASPSCKSPALGDFSCSGSVEWGQKLSSPGGLAHTDGFAWTDRPQAHGTSVCRPLLWSCQLPADAHADFVLAVGAVILVLSSPESSCLLPLLLDSSELEVGTMGPGAGRALCCRAGAAWEPVMTQPGCPQSCACVPGLPRELSVPHLLLSRHAEVC